jgi:hypothetical protein
MKRGNYYLIISKVDVACKDWSIANEKGVFEAKDLMIINFQLNT